MPWPLVGSAQPVANAHILAVVEATCRYREQAATDGPLFLGRDTHALSLPAFRSALEVLAAHAVDVRIDAADGYTPTPTISHAILTWNSHAREHRADGIVITPSHNPPEDGGIKYNPPDGGPADTDVTGWIEAEGNRLLEAGLQGVRRVPYQQARQAPSIGEYDYVSTYVEDLQNVVDMDAVRASGLKLGVDPLGGASVAYWQAIAERYRLDLTVVNPTVDPRFGFMTLDWDGKIRMDPSSPYAMASLVKLRDGFDLALGNDADADRHGIVTRTAGLLNPNHYLVAAIAYLFQHRPNWPAQAGIGKSNRFFVRIDYEQQIRQAIHVFNSSQVLLEMLSLPLQSTDFLLGSTFVCVVRRHGVEFLQPLNRTLHRCDIGQQSTQPALVDVELAAAGRFLRYRFLRLPLRAYEKDRLALGSHFTHVPHRVFEEL